jgi:hypothetical protein
MTPPPDPDDDAPGPVLSRAFWAAMGLAAASLIASAIVAAFGPRLFPLHPAPAPEARAGGLGAGAKGRYETPGPFRPGPP